MARDGVKPWPQRSFFAHYDTPTMEHVDGDGRFRIRESEPVGFLPLYPVANMPDASPLNYHFVWPDFIPWYQKEGG